jgi:sugar-specific transcriptional regulator TrmB
MKRELQLLGFQKNEALVYEVLVQYGPCRAGVLINKLTINRNSVYRALDTLVLDGYVSRVERNGVWEFQITDPHILLTNMRRKEAVFEQVAAVIEHYQTQAQRQIVVYEGRESYANFWIRSLERAPIGTINYVAGGEVRQWLNFMGKRLPEYFAVAKERKIRWYQLYFGITDEEKQLLRSVSVDIECRLWHKPPRPFPGNYNILHDTVLLHTFIDPPRIVEMKDDMLVAIFQNYFDMMWDEAEPIEV